MMTKCLLCLVTKLNCVCVCVCVCVCRVSPQLKVVQASVKAAEEQLEMLSRELQQRLNQLYVVVPLRLHQVAHPQPLLL